MSFQLCSERRLLYVLRKEIAVRTQKGDCCTHSEMSTRLCSGGGFLYTLGIEEPVQPLRRTALNAEKSLIYAQSELQLFLMLEVEYRVKTVLPHYR